MNSFTNNRYDVAGVKKVVMEIDQQIGEIYQNISTTPPHSTLLMITTSHGDTHTLEKLYNSLLWTNKEQKTAQNHVKVAQEALTFFCVK